MFHYRVFAAASHGCGLPKLSQNVVICRRLQRHTETAAICRKLSQIASNPENRAERCVCTSQNWSANPLTN
jgi:hypothetical protein